MSGGFVVSGGSAGALQSTLLAVQSAMALDATVFKQPTTVQTAVTAELASGTSGGFSAWTQLIASTAAAMRRAQFSGGSRYTAVQTGALVIIQIGQGAGGSEVVIAQVEIDVTIATTVGPGLVTCPWNVEVFKTIALGQRLAIRSSSSDASPAQISCGATFEEA